MADESIHTTTRTTPPPRAGGDTYTTTHSTTSSGTGWAFIGGALALGALLVLWLFFAGADDGLVEPTAGGNVDATVNIAPAPVDVTPDPAPSGDATAPADAPADGGAAVEGDTGTTTGN